VEKYGRAWQATEDNIIRRMRIARWINKATDPHLEYVILINFPRQKDYANASRYIYIACLVIFLKKKPGSVHIFLVFSNTDPYLEYVIIINFPRQKRYANASRFICIACLVIFLKKNLDL